MCEGRGGRLVITYQSHEGGGGKKGRMAMYKAIFNKEVIWGERSGKEKRRFQN